VKKRRRRRWGILLAVVLVALSLAAIAFVVVRPARLIGVDDRSISDSLVAEADATDGQCKPVPGGRANETAWRCKIARTQNGSGGASSTYNAQVDEWGCWEAHRVETTAAKKTIVATRFPADPSACILLYDYIHFTD
jgi:hypothetical protein